MNHKINYLKALKVASVVGTILLLINQYDGIIGDARFRVIPALLTYCVPFFVFILGQYSSSVDTGDQEND